MKILLAHITQNYSGVEKRFYVYAKHILCNEDNAYTVLLSRSFIATANENVICSNGNKIIKYGFPWKVKNKLTRYIDYAYLFVLLSVNMYNRYDIVHFPTTTSLIWRKFVRAKKKVHSVVNSETIGLSKILISKRFSHIMNAGYLIDCLDSNIRKNILAHFPEMPDQVFSSPCSFTDYTNTEVDSCDKKDIICFVGRLVGFKGISLLNSILKNIVQNTGYNIHILGKGTAEKETKQIIEENKLNDRVLLTYCNDPKTHLRESKIFLSLQRNENYPSQSLLEAMACKNAIIATNAGLTNTIIKDSFGTLINNSESELYNAIIKLTSSDKNLNEMGAKAREFVISNHNLERFHQYLISVYKNG